MSNETTVGKQHTFMACFLYAFFNVVSFASIGTSSCGADDPSEGYDVTQETKFTKS
jgi:hypothetical protein